MRVKYAQPMLEKIMSVKTDADIKNLVIEEIILTVAEFRSVRDELHRAGISTNMHVTELRFQGVKIVREDDSF